MLEVSYSNTVDELVGYLDHRASRLSDLRRHRLGSQLGLGVVAIGAAAVAVLVLRSQGLLPAIGGGVALAAALAALLLMLGPVGRFVRRLSWRRMLGGQGTEALRAPRRMRLEDGGLRVTAPGGEMFAPWSALQSVTELRDVVIVRLEPEAAHVIPRGAFASAPDREAFLAALRAHLVKEATAPAPPRR